MIKAIKEYDGKWMIWNKKNGKVATIVEISEHGLQSNKKMYRVDVNGKTVASAIEYYKTASSIARKHVA